jgi:hypothetical protein
MIMNIIHLNDQIVGILDLKNPTDPYRTDRLHRAAAATLHTGRTYGLGSKTAIEHRVEVK